ncbi:MAG: helix-turn-helix domain-containing protein [Pseudomonadota bacterium]
MSSAKPNASTPCLRQHVTDAVTQYLKDMSSTPPDNLYQVIIAEVEKPLIETVLEHTGGNQSRAAEMLGLTRGTLRNRIRRYGL